MARHVFKNQKGRQSDSQRVVWSRAGAPQKPGLRILFAKFRIEASPTIFISPAT